MTKQFVIAVHRPKNRAERRRMSARNISKIALELSEALKWPFERVRPIVAWRVRHGLECSPETIRVVR